MGCILVQIMAAGGQSYFELKNGAPKMPRLALGTWKSPPQKTKQAVLTAVRAGYRFIDCANDYDNEHVIGEALQELYAEGIVKRSDLFIQAKLWNSNHRAEHVEPDLDATLKDLGTTYVDSFVIHWPQACPSTGLAPTLRNNPRCPGISQNYPAHFSKGTMFPCDKEGYYCNDQESHYVETWKAMEKLVDNGKTKTIGLSNFNKTQVAEILSIPGIKHKPAILQNESHPHLQEKDLRDFCRINKIVFQAYSALGSADRPWRTQGSITSGPPITGHEVLDNPEILKLGKKYGKTSAQIVLRWHAQMGGSMVCKSVTPSRVEANYQIWDFALDADDMAAMDDLNVGWRHLMWAETSMHPDYPFKGELPYNYKLEKPGVGATAGAK